MGARIRKGQVRDTEQALAGFGRVDYADCYLFALPGNLGLESRAARLDAATLAVFERSPGMVEALLKLRNALVRPLGLRTDYEKSPERDPGQRIEPGEKVASFPVLARDDGEIVMGEQDRHLDFRVAVRLEDAAQGRELVTVTTWVHYNNWLGPAYFSVVRPFHGLVVRKVMAKGARRLARLAASQPTASRPIISRP